MAPDARPTLGFDFCVAERRLSEVVIKLLDAGARAALFVLVADDNRLPAAKISGEYPTSSILVFLSIPPLVEPNLAVATDPPVISTSSKTGGDFLLSVLGGEEGAEEKRDSPKASRVNLDAAVDVLPSPRPAPC